MYLSKNSISFSFNLKRRSGVILKKMGCFTKFFQWMVRWPYRNTQNFFINIELVRLTEHSSCLSLLLPPVLFLDEPTAGMSVDEVPVILNLIRQLKADKTKTILLVEHKMDVVRELSDRIIVLHNGELVADGDPAEVIASPVVQQAYLGINPKEAEVV